MTWIRIILRTARNALLNLLGIALVLFFLTALMPGDPARMMAGRHASEEQIQVIRHDLGLDESLASQFFRLFNDLSPLSVIRANATPEGWNPWLRLTVGESELVLKGPYLRKSYISGDEVMDIISEGLPETLVLAFTAVILALIIGIPLGVSAARNRNGFSDRMVSVFGATGMAVPSFLLAILVAWVFGYLLHDITGFNMSGSLFEYDVYAGREVLNLRNLWLPAFTLSVRPTSVVAQLMRDSMRGVLKHDYIRTARAKGLSEWRVLYRHALINAISPVATAALSWLASLMAGSVFVEYVFGWGGLGQVIVRAIEYQDFPVIMGLTLFTAFVFVLVNGVLNLLYPLIDPSLRNAN